MMITPKSPKGDFAPYLQGINDIKTESVLQESDR